jgi:hypothetical protein
VGDFVVTAIPLVCRECLELQRRDPSFRWIRHDVRRPTQRRYGVVRAMNVLNHLGRDDRVRALRSLVESLQPGGFLVVGRSVDPGGQALASLFARDARGVRLVRELHGGAEDAPLLVEALGTAPAE